MVIVGVLVLLAGIGGIGWLAFVKLDGSPPRIALAEEIAYINADQPLTVMVTDSGSGLARAGIRLERAGRAATLAEEEFAAPFVGRSGAVTGKTLKIRISPRELGLTDGRATLAVTAVDASWRNWFNGNRATLEKSVLIDTRPPDIRVVSTSHNLVSGGSGLVIYTLSEDCAEHGVAVDGDIYPGQPANDLFGVDSPAVYLAFIALAYHKDPGENDPGIDPRIFATDPAGNESRAGFPHYLRKGRFKDDVITISDRFLEWKMPEFSPMIPASVGPSPLARFIWVNRHLRKASYAELTRHTRVSDAKRHWEGDFLRLPGSARQASFADHREYRYNDRVIDRQDHMGIDLASFKAAEVPAANHGRVAFAGNIGIYGDTVVIDHGFGLFSTYSHLSLIGVKEGRQVRKGDVIGKTGVTGMAGGDHLHFGMMVRHTFVNPVEWWDEGWIRNNVLQKIEDAASELQYLK